MTENIKAANLRAYSNLPILAQSFGPNVPPCPPIGEVAQAHNGDCLANSRLLLEDISVLGFRARQR